MTLYLRLAGYLILTAIVFGSGWRVGSERWQTKYGAQLARADALDAQLRAQKAVSQNNAQVIHDLQAQRDDAVAERQRFGAAAQRMLNAQARAHPPDCPVPKATDLPGTAAASPAPSDGQVAQLLGNVVAECRANARALNALQEEIRPQL